LACAAEIEHFFNDPRHVPSLALRGVARMPMHRLDHVALTQGEHDRRERVAQLVRQDRYQPVLESVPGLPKLGVEADFRSSLCPHLVLLLDGASEVVAPPIRTDQVGLASRVS
jgi:hypothetical protein